MPAYFYGCFLFLRTAVSCYLRENSSYLLHPLFKKEIEHCIIKINNAIDALSSAAAEIERTMNELPNYWEGAAYENARTTYEEQYQTLLITTVPESVSSFRDYINTCMEKIIEIDEQLAGV